MSDTSDEETEVGVLIAAKDAALKPVYVAVSKPAQRAYLSTFLFFLTGFVLLGTAISAYLLFYYSYIPARGISKPIYLQFGPGHHPYGSASLSRALVANQRYDVKVVLHMPQTSSNKAAGNFMLDLQLLAPGASVNEVAGGGAEVLAHESRPAILTYHSQTMEQVHRAAALPLHLVGWREEAESLSIRMMEGVEFSKGWRSVPDVVRLELRSEEKLQVYNAKVEFTARLRGLRYVMYNYRVVSFLTLTSAFWMVEMAFAGVIWFALAYYVFPETPTDGTVVNKEDGASIKREPRGNEDSDGMSDTSRTFPTRTGQPPLRYSSPKVKEEDKDEPPPAEAQQLTAEADDEDEDADFVLDEPGPAGRGFSDSGIGTSLESSAGKPTTARRRRSRGPTE